MKSTIKLLTLLTLMITGCSKSTGPDSSEAALKYLPLEVGNMWKYRVLVFDSTANPKLDSSTTLREITGSFNWQGITVYEELSITDSDSLYNYLLYREGEIRRYPVQPQDTNFYYLILEDPIEPGNIWNYKSGNADDSLYITSVNTNTLVPAGFFENCIKICIKGEDCCGNYIFYAYGTGKVELLDFKTDGWLRRELIEYNLN